MAVDAPEPMPTTAELIDPTDHDLNVRLAELRGWAFKVVNDPDNYFGIAYASFPPGRMDEPGCIQKQRTPPDFVSIQGREAVISEIRSHGVVIVWSPAP